MRICPKCETRTEERFCRHDGYQTADASRYDAASEDPLVGKIFEERYLLEELIGKGGFGAVYRGRQIAVDRPVAIKVLRKELCENLQVLARFQQEARAVAGLKHPNIIELYDFGQSVDGGLYLVMELLEGEPLDERLRRDAPLETQAVVDIARAALDALGDAHDQGIIHRDLKPENLYVATQGRGREVLKILDFGIAKVADDGSGGGMTLTGTGMAIGSPRYMSPEQCSAVPVTAQSDLYSLGLILYEALGGRPAFEAPTPVAYMMAHVNTVPPRPERDGVLLQGPLVDLIMQCIAKDPRARPASADAALAILSGRGATRGGDAAETMAISVDGHAATAPELAANTIAVGTPSASRSVQGAAAKGGASGQRPGTPGPSGATLHIGDTGRQASALLAAFDTGHADSALGSAELAAIAPTSRLAVGAAIGAFVLLLGGVSWWATRPADAGPETSATEVAGAKEQASPAKSANKQVAAEEPAAAIVPAVEAKAAEPEVAAKVEGADEVAAKVEAAPAVAVEPEAAPEAVAPVKLEVTVQSSPPGALVMLGDERLGKTPLPMTWSSDEEPPTITLVRGGYERLEVVLNADDAGGEREYDLVRRTAKVRSVPVTAPVKTPPTTSPGFQPKPVSDKSKDTPKPGNTFKMVE